MPQYPDINVDYEGLETWAGPTTWGQRAMWAPTRWYAPHDYYFNVGRVLTLGSGLSRADLAAVLRDALTRHPALRTEFAEQPDGSARQILHGSGTVRVRHFEAERGSAETVARSILAEESRESFIFSAGPPVRVIAAGTAEIVYAVGLVAAHVTSDGGGMDVLVDDLRKLAAHRRRDPSKLPARPDGRTPREQVEYEAGPTMQRRGAAALEQWRTLLADAPSRPATEPEVADDGYATPDRWREAVLDGPTVDLASRWLAEQWHRSPGAVVLAAFVTNLTALTGRDPVILKVIMGNRAVPAQRTAVGNFVQDGLISLSPVGLSVADLAARADAALLTAARHGHYDPAAMRDLVAEVSAERGGVFELDSFFNDFRPAGATPAEPHVRALEPDPLRWSDAWAKQDSLMFLKVWPEGTSATVRLLVDTWRLSAKQAETILTGVQDLLLNEVRERLADGSD